MKTLKTILIALLLLGLAACGTGGSTEETQEPAAPTLDPQAMDAAVQATVSAELTRIALENPSPTPAPTQTSAPTEPAVPTETPAPSPTTSPLALDDHALFLADVTIPDGTEIIAGEPFTKIWRLQNIGLNAWTTEYAYVFVNGDQMDGFPAFLEVEVPPGGTLEISVPMIAPEEAGIYEGFWMLSNADGDIFGIGEEANQAFLVSIVVIEPTPEPTATPTTAPSPTATP